MTGLLAGIELGGTKCICVLGSGPDDVREKVRIPTGDPAATLAAIEAVLDGWRARGERFAAIGIASFGPLELDRQSPAYGSIVATTKPGWSHVDIAGRVARRYGLPVGFDTDVDGAALAEGRWGGAQGLDAFAYITVGTGIGVGLISAGRPLLGFTHSELGHIRIARAIGDDWPGCCPFHGDCVEGLASGPAIAARLGRVAASAEADDPVWELVAHSVGQLLHVLVLAAAPRRILIGGGVMQAQPQLFPLVRRQLEQSLAGYGMPPEPLDRYVVPPALGAMAGPLGALALAADASGELKSA